MTAIETAASIKAQGRRAAEEEKKTLAMYSGFGGIKEVLNIGTDVPMPDKLAEQMNRLRQALYTLAGGMKRNTSEWRTASRHPC